jgi:homogentisate 1,2-dioxygenase
MRYHTLGTVPRKRHTVFPNPKGGIHHEHLMGNLGFTGLSSLLYSIRPPTRVLAARHMLDLEWEADPDPTLKLRHFRAHRLSPDSLSPVLGRIPLLYNADVALSIAFPSVEDDFFYRNAMGDEIVFVTEGEGVLSSCFGDLPYRPGDYLVIPRGILHRLRLGAGRQVHFVVESAGFVRPPERYRNPSGQFLEHSPFCERDIRVPESLPVHDEIGEFRIVVKKGSALHEVLLDHHPQDTVGWDGTYYPWALNIGDFEPIVGRLHQPPPVHQTFAGDGFVVCSFVPRLYDFHPRAIPAPYNHSNVMSDEVLYYASSEFMSRKGIEYGSVTLHPDGMPHGPHPGKYEESVGKKETKELAVMVDTFRPLSVAKAALPAEDPDYHRSWLEIRED